MTTVSENTTIGFIGAGKMAYALASGFVNSGLVQASNIITSCRHPESPNALKDLGVMVTADNKEVVRRSQLVYISVKPYQVETVLVEVAPVVSGKNVFVSIAAGITIATLEEKLPAQSKVVRVIPNLPVQVRAGVTVVSVGSKVEDGDVLLVTTLMKSVGVCEVIPESLIDAVSGLSGSGPAYVFTAIEAMADGGVKMGLPRDLATKLAAQTMMGAAKMVLDTGKHPGQLKDEVCSPGGTTIAGIHKLEKAAFRASLMDAVEAAVLRTKELGQKK